MLVHFVLDKVTGGEELNLDIEVNQLPRIGERITLSMALLVISGVRVIETNNSSELYLIRFMNNLEARRVFNTDRRNELFEMIMREPLHYHLLVEVHEVVYQYLPRRKYMDINQSSIKQGWNTRKMDDQYRITVKPLGIVNQVFELAP